MEKKKIEEEERRRRRERRRRTTAASRRGEGGGSSTEKERERDAEEQEEETSRVASSLVVHSPPRGVSRPPHFIKGAETREKERKKEKERVSTGTKLKKIIGQKFQTSTLTQKKERGEREEPSSSSLEVRVALRVRTPRRAKDGERRREENVVVVFPVEETVR